MSGLKKSNSVLQKVVRKKKHSKATFIERKTEARVVLTGRLSVYLTSLVGGYVGEIFYQGASC